ncbi:MAG: DUF1223 domain-containing protein [Candidatus Korobacteraceae bacterium]
MPKFPFPVAVVVLLLLLTNIAWLPKPAEAQQPVVVELFTSEGCSSCPPADAMLTKLSHQRDTNIAKLILLEEHVEYWNNGGWKDPFSGPTYTDRQYHYTKYLHLQTAYTPQIVVDGHLQASGNNPRAVQDLILEAAKVPMPAAVSLNRLSPDKLQVSVNNAAGEKLDVLLAVTEDDLTNNVRAGENSGKTLTHSAVVRELHRLGSTADGKFDKTISLPDKSGWKKDNLRAIVLVQNPSSGVILGAAEVPYVTSAAAGGK